MVTKKLSKAELQLLEDGVITTAEALVLTVLNDAVRRGVTGLVQDAGACLSALNRLHVARRQPQV